MEKKNSKRRSGAKKWTKVVAGQSDEDSCWRAKLKAKSNVKCCIKIYGQLTKNNKQVERKEQGQLIHSRKRGRVKDQNA